VLKTSQESDATKEAALAKLKRNLTVEGKSYQVFWLGKY
jgi:hypothetical protein